MKLWKKFLELISEEKIVDDRPCVKFINAKKFLEERPYLTSHLSYCHITDTQDEIYFIDSSKDIAPWTPMRITIKSNNDTAPYVDKWLSEPWNFGFPTIEFTNTMLAHIDDSTFSLRILKDNTEVVIIENANLSQAIEDYDDLMKRIKMEERLPVLTTKKQLLDDAMDRAMEKYSKFIED